jgi:hypothetical protein
MCVATVLAATGSHMLGTQAIMLYVQATEGCILPVQGTSSTSNAGHAQSPCSWDVQGCNPCMLCCIVRHACVLVTLAWHIAWHTLADSLAHIS